MLSSNEFGLVLAHACTRNFPYTTLLRVGTSVEMVLFVSNTSLARNMNREKQKFVELHSVLYIVMNSRSRYLGQTS